MRIPKAVHSGKAGRGERLVNGGVGLYPRVSLGHAPGVAGQFFIKGWGVEGGVAGATAVMHQTHHRPDIEHSQPVQPFVGPAPVQLIGVMGGGAFPQNRVAERTYAQFSNAVEIVGPVVMTTPPYLILVHVAHPVDGALDTAPQG